MFRCSIWRTQSKLPTSKCTRTPVANVKSLVANGVTGAHCYPTGGPAGVSDLRQESKLGLERNECIVLW